MSIICAELLHLAVHADDLCLSYLELNFICVPNVAIALNTHYQFWQSQVKINLKTELTDTGSVFHLVCILIELFETAKTPPFEKEDKILDAILRLATPINHDLPWVGIVFNHMLVLMNVGTTDTFGTEIALYLEIIEDI